MKKIIIFAIRLFIFIFSYLLYLFNLFFIYLNFKNVSKLFFIFAAYFCSKSLGLSYKFEKELKLKLIEKGIHIANHDNPLDIFVAQYIFRMPTVTTISQHLKEILPFFEISLKNFGHFSFNHLDPKDRLSAYLFLNEICKTDNNVLIFPSGSIYTSINKRFSKSISKLSMAYDLKVIAWQFNYREFDKNNYLYNKDIFKFLVERFFSGKIEFNVKKVKVFSPNDFSSEKKYYEEIKKFYMI